MRKKELEEGGKLNLDFGKLRQVAGKCQKVIPVVVQDCRNKEVLILAYANEQALRETLEKGVVVFWSTSRGEIWVKGETSGCVLKIKEVRVNCEQNSLLYLVEAGKKTGACHVEDENGRFRESCFYRKITGRKNKKLAFC